MLPIIIKEVAASWGMDEVVGQLGDFSLVAGVLTAAATSCVIDKLGKSVLGSKYIYGS